ncbi:hypothetical protein ElyMa_003789400 [Elysia marginata]|uniref:Uncharacterized protein n=1 Tax=Elysia marginata TaxID=1093978 RepID=A0AAV4FBB4_9GAST|nr:hypothetical protein ElyMa_003789400 [Elysia marginata]
MEDVHLKVFRDKTLSTVWPRETQHHNNIRGVSEKGSKLPSYGNALACSSDLEFYEGLWMSLLQVREVRDTAAATLNQWTLSQRHTDMGGPSKQER